MPERDRQFETWFEPQGTEKFSTVQTNSGAESPTSEIYADIDTIAQFIGDRQFDGEMPKIVITFNRRRRTTAYIATDAFESIVGDTAHELSFNIAQLRHRDDRFTMSVVACAIAAAWRDDLAKREKPGTKPTRGYCDRRLADKLERMGLVPSDTGKPGGKRTGFRVSYFIVEGGQFDLDAKELMATGFRIRWRDHPVERGDIEGSGSDLTASDAPSQTRARFACQSCSLIAWAKPSARLGCLNCSTPMSITT